MRGKTSFSKFFKSRRKSSNNLSEHANWKLMQAWASAYTTIPLESLLAEEFEAAQDCPILKDYEDAMNRIRAALKQLRHGGLTDQQIKEQTDALEDAMSSAAQAMKDITFIAGLSVGHKRTITQNMMRKEEAAAHLPQ